MHPAATPPPQTLLDQITHLLPHLLSASHSIKTFTARWQTIRSKLSSLNSSLSLLSDSPHWSDNPLLQTLLPNLLQTLLRIQTLSLQCSSDPQNPPVGKLLMQSDLDMAANWLSKLSNDLDLLLRSGVLRHSNAIVLSQPPPGSDKEDLAFFIRDLFTRLQIGGVEFKKKAMESLLHLLENDEKSPALVSKEGNVSYLVHLLDLNTHPSIREQAIAAVSLLASASEQSRKCVFEEGGLGPLLRIIESGSIVMKEKAAMAVEAITADVDNAWAVSAYGGVSVLLEACRSGSLTLQEHSLGALRNVAVVEDVSNALSEEGAVPVVVPLLVNGTVKARENTAGLIAVLASSGEYFRALIVQQRGLQGLLLLLHESSCADTIEHVLRAIYSLCASDPVTRTLSVSTSFLVQIAEIIKHGSVLLQQISASILATLSISDGNKRAIASCMPALVKLMELPKPDGMQEMAARALVSLLTVKSNRKQLVRDEKSVMRMAQMLDPRYEAVSKKFPVAVVAAVMAGGSKGCRKRLVAAGAYAHIQKLAEIEVAGARKAAQRLSGNRLKVIFGRTWKE